MVSQRTKEYFEQKRRERDERVAMEVRLRRAFESRVDASTQTEPAPPNNNQQPTSPTESELLLTPDRSQTDDAISIHPDSQDFIQDEPDVRKVKKSKKAKKEKKSKKEKKKKRSRCEDKKDDRDRKRRRDDDNDGRERRFWRGLLPTART